MTDALAIIAVRDTVAPSSSRDQTPRSATEPGDSVENLLTLRGKELASDAL
jgi:hypothetical protein